MRNACNLEIVQAISFIHDGRCQRYVGKLLDDNRQFRNWCAGIEKLGYIPGDHNNRRLFLRLTNNVLQYKTDEPFHCASRTNPQTR